MHSVFGIGSKKIKTRLYLQKYTILYQFCLHLKKTTTTKKTKEYKSKALLDFNLSLNSGALAHKVRDSQREIQT